MTLHPSSTSTITNFTTALSLKKLKGLIFVSGVFAAVIIPVQSFADTNEKNQKAKSLFEEGMNLYEEEEYGLAVVKFHEVYDLTHENDLLYNIAVCYEKMGQKEKAIEYYGRYLDGKKEKEESEDSKKVKKKIESLRKAEEGEEETEEGEEEEEEEGISKKKETKKKQTLQGEGIERGKGGKANWSHGLRFLLAGHLSGELLYYKEPGWTVRAGYNFRFSKGKGSIIVEAGYGWIHEEYFKSRVYDIFGITFIFDWQVFEYRERTLQIFVGGGMEFDYLFRGRRGENRFYLLIGPDAALEWNMKKNFGFIFSFDPLFGYWNDSPHWALGFVLKVGIIWGLK